MSSVGLLEYRSIGIVGNVFRTLSFHHSTIPFLKKAANTCLKWRISMRPLAIAVVTLGLGMSFIVKAGEDESRPRFLIDRNHGGFYQKGDDGWRIQNLKRVAKAIGSVVIDVEEDITDGVLADADVLYIGVVTTAYAQDEKEAIIRFVKDGGTLCLVMEEDYWCSLDETGVNDLIAPFDMRLSETIVSKHNCGATAKVGPIHQGDREIPYSGGRHVMGGTPSSIINDTDNLAHAAYRTLPGGGKVVVMGDAMACLLMGDRNSVRLSENGYWGKDSRVFLQELLTWLTHSRPAPAADAAGKVIAPDLTKIATGDDWRVFNREAKVTKQNEKLAVHFNGLPGAGGAWLETADFAAGVIECDIKGKSQRPSFVGVAFHAQDAEHFEAVYFRAFNFRNEARRQNSVQYISHPDHTWWKLRQDSPGKYESAIDPAPDPDGFFHVKLVVEKPKISVYVNQAEQPCLVVESLSNRTSGKIGLWVDNESDGAFANLRIIPQGQSQPSQSGSVTTEAGYLNVDSDLPDNTPEVFGQQTIGKDGARRHPRRSIG